MAGQEQGTMQELQRLREVDAFKTRFLNMAAHELNTPLTPLKLQMHLVLSGQLGDIGPRSRHALEIADRNVNRIHDLVREILEVARLQGGGLRFKVEAVNVPAALAEAVDNFATAAKAIGIDLSFAAQADVVVKTDRDRLMQILLNLISNGLKFTPAGGKVAMAGTAVKGKVIVEVTDTGIGMTKEQMQQIFQPFVQVHDPMQITSPGTGLGLYISRGLAEAMGGTLTCQSKGPATGTTFTLTLPQSFEPSPAKPVPMLARRDSPDEIARRIRELI